MYSFICICLSLFYYIFLCAHHLRYQDIPQVRGEYIKTPFKLCMRCCIHKWPPDVHKCKMGCAFNNVQQRALHYKLSSLIHYLGCLHIFKYSQICLIKHFKCLEFCPVVSAVTNKNKIKLLNLFLWVEVM